MRHELEALLFATGKPLKPEEIAKHTGKEVKVVLDELAKLRTWYSQQDSALIVHETPHGWKLTTKDEYHEITKKVVADTELPFPEMETLAVIAYKNPVLQSDVIKVRGAGAYDQIATLEEEGFIKKDKEGRSYLLRLTEHFFKYFDVEGEGDIKQLFQSKRPVHLMEQLEHVPKVLKKKHDKKAREQEAKSDKKKSEKKDTNPETPIEVEHQETSNDEILATADRPVPVVEEPLAEHEKKRLEGKELDGQAILAKLDEKLDSLGKKVNSIEFEKPKRDEEPEEGGEDESKVQSLPSNDDIPPEEKPQA